MRSEVRNILLVDDDPDDCFLFRKALADIDPALMLQFLSDTDDVLPSLTHSRPDIVFMDINMPKRSGFDCIQQLIQLPDCQNLPIVMYSCSDQPAFISKAYQTGAHLYLQKPASYEGLVSSLKKILKMDWQEPRNVTKKYVAAGHYYPFEVA